MTQEAIRDSEKIDRLGTGKISKLLLEFAIPAITGVVVNGLYNIIDTVFLGHGVGEIGLAATTVALPSMMILIGFAMLAGVGGNALAAIRLGEGKIKEVEKALGNSFTLLILIAIFVEVFALLAGDRVLILSGATEESLPYSRLFFHIICAGFIFQSIGMGINNFIRTAGDPKRALFTMVIGAVACVIFNYLFVIRFGWGVAGSALATILGQAVSAGLVLQYFLSKRAPFRLKLSNMKLDVRMSMLILSLGLASFAIQVASCIVNIILNVLVVQYGAQSIVGAEGALAAIGVVSKVAMFCIFPIVGVSMAAQPLIGYNYGAHNYMRVKQTLKIAILWATAMLIFFYALIHLFPHGIAALFGISDELLNFTVEALKVFAFAFPIIGAQIIGSNYFQATGQPMKSAVLSLMRQLIFLVPLIYWLPRILPTYFPTISGLMAVCYATPTADVLSSLFTGVFVLHEVRRLDKLMLEHREHAMCSIDA